MNRPIDYEYEITSEDVGNTTGLSDKNYVQKGNTNALYRSYQEATRETIKPPMALPQECDGGSQNPEVMGRDQITRLMRANGFFYLTAAMGSAWKSDSLYNHIHVYWPTVVWK